MELSDILADRDLGEYLSSNGVDETIYYDFERPTSGLPPQFIEVVENGAIQRLSSDSSLYRATLAVTINVKLMSTGKKNFNMEQIILKKIEKALAKQNKYSISQFTMFKGKNIDANYSYKTINIITNIY